MRQVPVDQQLGLDQEGVEVVGRQAVVDARRDRQRRRATGWRCKLDQHVDRGRIALLDRRRRIARDHAFGAEILQQQQAFVEVGRMDLRRRQAALAQRARHRDERLHVLGEMRDRAVGQAAAHRRPVRAARRVHQDQLAALVREPLVGAASRRRPARARAARRRGLRRRGTAGSPQAARAAARTRHAR